MQKVPGLLDEVHWLIENAGIRFVLCRSNARKVRRGQANLLGGRAVRYELHPLVYPEVTDFALIETLNRGMLPRHYRSPHASRLMQSYVGDYLREEIAAEDTLIRKVLPAVRRRPKRRLIGAANFYFFDIGIVAHLTRRGQVLPGSELFGKAFEHFIWMEIVTHSGYSEKNYQISY